MTDLDTAIRERIELVPDLDSLGENVRFKYDVEPVQAALLAVLDLHRPRTAVEGPLEGSAICNECSDGTDEFLAKAHPCPTLERIAEKLGISLTG